MSQPPATQVAPTRAIELVGGPVCGSTIQCPSGYAGGQLVRVRHAEALWRYRVDIQEPSKALYVGPVDLV